MMLMAWDFTSSTLVYVMSGLVTFLAASVSWLWKENPRLHSLAKVMFFISVYCFMGVLEMSVSDVDQKLFLITLGSFFIGISNIYFLFFIIDNYWSSAWLQILKPVHFFIFQVAMTLFQSMNPIHHWIWTGFKEGPAGSNIVVFELGPGFFPFIAAFLMVPFFAVVLIAVKMFFVDRFERKKLLMILVAALLPFLTYFAYLLPTDRVIGVILLPAGYATSGLLLTFSFFLDAYLELKNRSDDLEEIVNQLVEEGTQRVRLEKKIRDARDMLANKLAKQSRDLASLYDLMIISSKGEPHEVVLDACLKKLMGIINCPAIAFYQLHSANKGTLVSAFGLESGEQESMALLAFPQNTVRTEIFLKSRRKHPENAFKEITSSGFRSWAVKIMRIGDIEKGALVFLWKKQHAFEIDEIALLSALSDLVGVIIENDRLRSDERIMTLQDERRRLARDLHDSVTQSLHSLKFSAESARLVAENDPQALHSNLIHLSASAAQALKEMRLMLYELRLQPLEKIRLVDALRLRLDTVEKKADVQTELIVSGADEIPRDWEPQLYPIAMEALNNALKHSRSTAVTVRIERGKAFIMQISDNGLGFDSDQPDPGGMGLRSMAERVESIGGRLEIESNPGAGTCVSVIIETSEKDEDAG